MSTLISTEVSKTINGYRIYKGGTWCEVTKNGQHIFDGSVDESMTCEDIYIQVTAKVVFSYKGKELVNYDKLHEFSGERKSTIESLARENNYNIEEIKTEVIYETVE